MVLDSAPRRVQAPHVRSGILPETSGRALLHDVDRGALIHLSRHSCHFPFHGGPGRS